MGSNRNRAEFLFAVWGDKEEGSVVTVIYARYFEQFHRMDSRNLEPCPKGFTKVFGGCFKPAKGLSRLDTYKSMIDQGYTYSWELAAFLRSRRHLGEVWMPPLKTRLAFAVKRFRCEVYDKAKTVDPGSDYTWDGVVVGFLMGCGIPRNRITPEIETDLSIGEFDKYLKG
jgi:hypothetical protein